MIEKSLLLLHLLLQLSPAGTTESSIIGGKKAKPHSRPYMVSLQVDGSHTCGGFLVREDFVLTAAHCFSSRSLTAVLGAENLKKTEKKFQQKIPVKKYYKHQINQKSKFDFDIMLLKLQRNATINKNVKVIPLPKKGETVPENTKCLMSGWGRKKPDGPAQDFLQEVVLSVLSNKNCKKVWQENFVGNRMMCTRYDGKGICEGDSGGPLICNNKPHGIASFMSTPCNEAYPNVYMKVSYFIPWIEETMSN
ncbi:granzyme B-like isoform X1 [Anguilla anguilla]|uniref:granzyme B-like isoform X1 n=1 Tax=Anguilla anguilla TaxID=7936 RepID=UPI0015AFDCDC|nr:granzyme B-like isoform X1 [Anguilla anguilla]